MCDFAMLRASFVHQHHNDCEDYINKYLISEFLLLFISLFGRPSRLFCHNVKFCHKHALNMGKYGSAVTFDVPYASLAAKFNI